MTDLLPCPFCGSNNLRYEFSGSQGYIECNECGIQGPCDERAADPICDLDAAYDAWNRRTALAQPEQVAPTDEELLELMPEEMRDDLAELSCIAAQHHGLKPGIFRVVLNTNVMAYARAVLARWGTLANNTNYDHE